MKKLKYNFKRRLRNIHILMVRPLEPNDIANDYFTIGMIFGAIIGLIIGYSCYIFHILIAH